MKHFPHLCDKENEDRMPSNIKQKQKPQTRNTKRHKMIDEGALGGGLLKRFENHCG